MKEKKTISIERLVKEAGKETISIEELVKETGKASAEEIMVEILKGIGKEKIELGEDALLYSVKFKGKKSLYIRDSNTGLHQKVIEAPTGCWFKGNSILFYSQQDKGIYCLDLNSNEKKKIIELPSDTDFVDFIRYRDKIDSIFFLSSAPTDWNGKLYSVKSNGKNLQHITDIRNNGEISFSYDGSKIAFIRWSGNYRGYTANIDGSNERLLADKDTKSIKFAPNKKILAILYDTVMKSPYSGPLYLFRLNGTNKPQKLAKKAGSFCWNPNGTKIAYVDGDLNIIDINTKSKTNMYIDWHSDNLLWSPSGNLIAYVYCHGDFLSSYDSLHILKLDSEATYFKKYYSIISKSKKIKNLQFKPK